MEHRAAIRAFIVACFALAPMVVFLPLGCRPAEEPGPPPEFNVILISVDTLRADHLNCYGYQKRRLSRNIDALAADGILFENCITSSPWTTPAHMTMLTSLYPTAHGITQTVKELRDSLEQEAQFNRLPDSRLTLAEVLKANGYATGAFTGGGTMDPRIGFDQGFDRYASSMHKLHNYSMREMNEWIDHHAERPFFLFWHTFEVHPPYIDGTYLDEVLPPETAAEVRGFLQDTERRFTYRAPTLDEQYNTVERSKTFLNDKQIYNAEVCEALYDGGIASMDSWLGDFLRRLRLRGLYDRSLIILTSDHGEEFEDHLRGAIYAAHGHSVYDEMVRVPLIIKLPHRQFAGMRITSTARMIDLMPTVLDVLGIRRRPKDMQGLSLRPLWEQPDTPHGRLAVSEALAAMSEKKAVRTERYKFMYSLDPDTVAKHGRNYVPDHLENTELYDLHADPKESTNLLESPRSGQIAELAAALEQHLRDFAKQPQGKADTVELDEETIENLRALGYLD
ncbi:MAG: sulfatase [Phycisphaerales bacterium]|nr:MAG: sulfatase [Phycisphaerales bacterium]